jgi:eukaryotic-like serine/threonine-protein kinase
MARNSMTLRAGSRLGPYEILAPLGEGGMGEVYRAKDPRLGREVAIKVLPAALLHDTDRLQRFEREAQAASALNHPAIVTVHDIGREGEIPYVVLELLEGETLRARLAHGPLAQRRTLEYAVSLAQGLGAAHEKGIVHRDFKPENIFLTQDGRTKILDFGLAKVVEMPLSGGAATDVPTSPGTTPGVVLGTIGYMSPEQVRGEPADQRSDLFAFGAVLYEMLSGKKAFDGPTVLDALHAILRQEPPDLPAVAPDVSPGLERIVRRCLEKNPAERFQSARDLSFALGESGSTPRVPEEAPRRRVPRTRGIFALAALAAAALLAATLFGWGRLRDRFRGAPAPIRSLAVLPLENFSKDPEQEYFADGMTEALITDLAQVRSLRVISRTSAMAYKGTKKTVPAIARELGVDGILEGSVERAGNRVRITTQLIEGATDRHVWARSYERDLKDVLALQGEVASAVASEVRAAVTPAEQGRLTRARTVDPEAYGLTLKGRYQLNQADSRKAIDGAIATFQKALASQPDYAPAWSGLADAYAALTDFYLAPHDTMPKARAAAERALTLDETLAEAHASLGIVHLIYDWDWAGAERELQRAIALNPNLASAHDGYGTLLAVVGRADESETEMRKAEQLDPLASQIAFDAGWNAAISRRYERSAEAFRQAFRIDPAFGYAHINLGVVLVLQGRRAEGLPEVEAGLKTAESPLAVSTAGTGFAIGGESARARQILDRLSEMSKTNYICPYETAIIHMALGDKDKAFSLFEKGYDDHSVCMMFTKQDPRLDPIRPDARYQDLVRRLNYPP